MDSSDYREYLEFFNDDSGRRPKLSRAQFFDRDEELVDLITWESIRKHSPEQRERQNFLLYLLQSAGTTYGSLSPANRLELEGMCQRKKRSARSEMTERDTPKLLSDTPVNQP